MSMGEQDQYRSFATTSSSTSDPLSNNEYLQDKNNYEGEHILIDEIDNNFYLVQDGEEKESTSFFNESANRYSIIGRIFDNLDVAYDFYNEYGLSRGFGIRRHQSYKDKVTNIVFTSIFVCNKQGYKNMNDKRRLRDDIQRRCITRTGCMAMIQVTCSKQGEWAVKKFHDEHNHPLDPPSKVLRQRSHSIFHRSKECKDVVTLLSNSGIKPSDITKVMNALRGSERDRLTRVQCSNIVTNERKINLGKECHGIIMHFQEKAELDQEFYFAMELSTDGTLRNVFWADGRSRSSFCQFGDVVVFDTTYRTNKFNLPFAPFVGVNHHGQSILFGAALLENETETSFIWLFKQFLKCMHECPPVSIITDQDLAMGKAIAKVFPKTRHRFCAWHIQKHILEHLQPLRSRYDDFKETFNRWLKSENVEDFESKWGELKNKYDIADDSWLGNMYSLRHQWVKSYLKDTFFAGMTTSGRCESMHSFFDGYVNSKTMLNDFVRQYDKALSSRRGAEEDQDHRTVNSKPTLHSDHPIEAMASHTYTRNIYDIFKNEWKNSFDCGHETLNKDSCLVKYRVGLLKVNKEYWRIVEYRVSSDFYATCSCAKFETYGILCKHILYIMRKKSVKAIPDHYILPRWTMKATYKDEKNEPRWRCSDSNATGEVTLLTLWSIRSKFNKIIEDRRDSPIEMKKVEFILDDLLDGQNQRKNTRVEPNTNSSAPVMTERDISQETPVLDPKIPVKTKGRPKVATRIKGSLEISMDPKKKRTCGYCKGKGHNRGGCQQKKMDDARKDNIIELA